MTAPLITIGIPCYNQQEYLSDAIESALGQTIKAEVIVCNDGSTDNSLDIAKKYPVKIIDQVNKGLPSARNSLIMNMSGKYFLPLDADDILMDNCVERIEQTIAETGADIIGLSFKEFGISSANVTLHPSPIFEDFKIGNYLPYCSAIKKEALLEVGGYSSRMIWGAEDYALWCDLLKRGKKLVTLQETLWLYRTKKDSMWSETKKHEAEFMAQIRKDHF